MSAGPARLLQDQPCRARRAAAGTRSSVGRVCCILYTTRVSEGSSHRHGHVIVVPVDHSGPQTAHQTLADVNEEVDGEEVDYSELDSVMEE